MLALVCTLLKKNLNAPVTIKRPIKVFPAGTDLRPVFRTSYSVATMISIYVNP